MAAIPRDARIFVAGHAGLVGSAVVDRLQADGFTTILTATRSELDLRDQAAVNYWFHDRAARVRVPRGRHRRRDHGQLHPAGRVPLRQHADPRHRRRGQQAGRRRQAPLPRQLVHLPPPGRASRSPRTSSSPARSSRPTRPTPSPRSPASSCARPTARSTAATSSRPCPPTSTARATTSTRSAATSCRCSCAASTRPGGASEPKVEVWGTGQPAPRAAARRRPGRRLPLPDGPLRRTPATSTSAPARTSPSATSPSCCATSSTPAPSWSSTPPSPTACPARCSTCPGSTTSAGATASGCRRARGDLPVVPRAGPGTACGGSRSPLREPMGTARREPRSAQRRRNGCPARCAGP